MNSLKHGNRSQKLARLREESCAFEERLRKWMAIGDAQNDVEEYLVYRNVCLSFELDRAERARVERCTMLIENADEDEDNEAQGVGNQLFFDPSGPTPLYGNPTLFSRKKNTSWNGQAVDPDDPAALVKILERSAAGCCWLREEWQALRAQLESTGFWQSHDRLKAIRLLGRQPVEANEDRRVATIFVASHALGPAGKSEFHDLKSDMEDEQRSRYGKAVRERWPDLFGTREKEEWKQILLALVDRNIERLSAKLEVHEQNGDAQAERTFARLSFDPSPEGESLRNYLIKCTNALFRGMANYRKHQARKSGGSGGAMGLEWHGTQQEMPGDLNRLARFREGEPPGEPISQAARTEPRPPNFTTAHSGREAYESDASELRVDESFGSGDCLDDRLERTDAIDPDGVEQHGDELSGMGEIGENAPSEANFGETTSIVEAQESTEVTSDSGAFSGLDNGADQPEEGSTPEQGKAPGSGSPSGDPDQETPDSGDRACAGSLPALVSKREQRRLQRKEERRAVEKMVEETLTSGRYSPGEIIMTAMKMPLPGDLGP